MSNKKLNKRLSAKNEKILRDIKKMQNETVNTKELSRKLNHNHKKLESLQKKHDKLSQEYVGLKEEKVLNVKEINQLKDSLNVVNQSKNRLDENKKNLENELKIINEQRDEITMELKTEKQVVEGLKCELMKFHQINGEQNESLKEANE